VADDRLTGTVARIFRDKAYGFIYCPAAERDYFFHKESLANCTIAQLTEGSEVRFVVGERNGRVQADDVELLYSDPPQGHRSPKPLPPLKRR